MRTPGRNCTGCGKWLQCDDSEECKECDPQCVTCLKRVGEVGALVASNCAECIHFFEAEEAKVAADG